MADFYVTVLGGGLHDGSSVADAWTFAEMLANFAPADGDICWIQKGTYTEGTITLPTIVSGTVRYCGFITTKDDLEPIQDPFCFKILNIADYPTINCNKLTIGGNSNHWARMKCLNITTTSYPAVQNNCMSEWFGVRLVGNSTSVLTTNVLIRPTLSGTAGYAFNCEFYFAGSGANGSGISRVLMFNCYFENTLASSQRSCMVGGSLVRCVIKNWYAAIAPGSGCYNTSAWNTLYGMRNNATATVQNNGFIFGSILYRDGVENSSYMDEANSPNLGKIHSVNASAFQDHSDSDQNLSNFFPVTISADPFVDAANGDFTLNDDASGGALCKGVLNGGDIGAIQSAGGAAALSSPFRSPVFGS